jgi:glycosyltransferase involved in cell wall biosynthesis
MRVGVYIPSYPPEAGGGFTFERDILRALFALAGESHHNFTVFSSGSVPEIINALRPNQISFYDITGSFSLFQRLLGRMRSHWDPKKKYLSHLNTAVEKLEMDCVWFMTPVYLPVNIPYITMVWDLQHRLQPWFPEVGTHLEWKIREKIYSDLIQKASYILTGTNAGRDEISLFYQIPKQRIRILPLPTPAFAVHTDEDHIRIVLEKYELKPGFLFYPAQFWPHKNHINLLLAVKRLLENYNILIDVVFVGSDKGNIGYIKKISQELGIEQQVHLLGFVTQDELIALYQSAFALTFVSFFGPENLPPLEAFVLGCPVIASFVSGAEEQLGDAALLVNPSEPETIAEAVKLLMDDPDQRTVLIERGYERASLWNAKDFMRSVFKILDEFEPFRRSWK